MSWAGRLRGERKTQARRRAAAAPAGLPARLGHHQRAQALGQFIAVSQDGQPWLHPNDVNAFARYLSDYLLSDHAFPQLCQQLTPGGELEDQGRSGAAAGAAEVRADHPQRLRDEPGREPGPRRLARRAGRRAGQDGRASRFAGYGLMGPLVEPLEGRLPQSLGLGAGEHVQIPPGNCELIQILEPFEK